MMPHAERRTALANVSTGQVPAELPPSYEEAVSGYYDISTARGPNATFSTHRPTPTQELGV